MTTTTSTITNRYRVALWIAAAILIVLLLILYQKVNPSDSSLFPKCPFLVLTGLKCPGCGSQRAIHYLLNLQIVEAFKMNALMVISIPFIIALTILSLTFHRSRELLKWRDRLYSQRSISIILIVVVNFWIFRNILSF